MSDAPVHLSTSLPVDSLAKDACTESAPNQVTGQPFAGEPSQLIGEMGESFLSIRQGIYLLKLQFCCIRMSYPIETLLNNCRADRGQINKDRRLFC